MTRSGPAGRPGSAGWERGQASRRQARGLDELVSERVVGAVIEQHVSVMGYQGYGDDRLRAWWEGTAPAVVDELRDMRTDDVVAAPV